MSKLTELTDASFRGFIQSSRLAVVDFYADWCMPCKLMGPVIESVASDLDGSARFAKINVDALLRPDTKTRYEAHKIALDAGFLTIDEVRELENREPLAEEPSPDPDPVPAEVVATPLEEDEGLESEDNGD